MPVGVLAEILIADPSPLTRNLAMLLKESLIEVSPRSAMRRRFALTGEGAAALARCVRRWRRIQTEFVGSFGDLRWKEMQKALEDLASCSASQGSLVAEDSPV